ncbi:MAG: peptide MFS transporter [Bacteroidales bacterium]|nr:peptide MFS transporter [Bacteroidales bacterium]MCI2121705.1 peptide MFS transporter [Bacteroidales bacterium]MCI2145787.1 peptide MFS transporter [Bacteroidales bacterium]
MGERFGYYTMMAILTLFMMSQFDLDGKKAGTIYSGFLTAIYIMSVVGGIIADRTRNYKGTITTGLVIMAVGYVALAIPGIKMLWFAVAALMVIAFGNGLFKGNLQAIVGQLYDNPKYDKMRDSGFQIFYMFINLGAVIAPAIATGIRNGFLKLQGFGYNSDLSDLCHQFLNGQLDPSSTAFATFNTLANSVSTQPVTNLTSFANNYLNAFNTGFHYAFAVAIFAMLISLAIFLTSKKSLPDPQKQTDKKDMSAEEIKQDANEIKQRIYALLAVFAIVIFFWFSFHQNGLTLTLFAKDYTHLSIFGKPISAEDFQSINPFCVVVLTPLVMLLFSSLRKKGKEPSTPRKIAYGMGIAALAYVVMTIGSIGLPKLAQVQKMGGLPDSQRVTPWLLLATYLILTVAELFISPLGLSFVSKVAPRKMQGLMQGCWLGATALGNMLLSIGPLLYYKLNISMVWLVFVIVCAISMIAMLAMVNWLERVTGEKKPESVPIAENASSGNAD